MKRIQINASYAVMQGASWSTYAVIMVYATNFLRAKGLPIYQVSLLLGAVTACACLLQVQLGELVSRVRKIKGYMVLLALCVLMSICGIAMMSENTIVSVAGMGMACVLLQTCPGMVNSVGMDAITKGVPAQYGLARGLGSLTYSGVVQAVGILVASFSIGVIPIAFILVSVCLAIGTVWFHRCAETDLPDTWQETARNQRKNGNFWKENPKFLFLLIGIVLILMGHNLLNSYMEIIVNAKNGGPAEQGTAMAICSAVELPIMAAFPFLERRIRCSRLLQISALGFAVRALGLFLANGPMGVYIAQVTSAFGAGLYTVSAVCYVGRAMKPADVIRGQSYLATAGSIGSLIAMFSGGVLYQMLGVQITLLLSALFAVVGGAFVLRCTVKKE